jgi:hypothetical protein
VLVARRRTHKELTCERLIRSLCSWQVLELDWPPRYYWPPMLAAKREGASVTLKGKRATFGKSERNAGAEILDDYSLTQKERSKTVSDLKDKVANAADAVRSTAEQVIDKSNSLAHGVGEKIEESGHHLQDA